MKPPRRPGRMPLWQRVAFWMGMGLCCLSGLSYLLGREFYIATGWLGHRSVLMAHGVSAGVAVFVLGTIAAGHIRVGWILKRNRASGMGNLVTWSLLALTGWGLYYGSEEIRDLTVLAHWVLGLAFVGALSWHLMPLQSRR